MGFDSLLNKPIKHRHKINDIQDLSEKLHLIDKVDDGLKNHLAEYNGLSQLFMGLEEQVHTHVAVDFPALKNEVDSLKQQGGGTTPAIDVSLVVSTTYAELKALRDTSGLSVGTW